MCLIFTRLMTWRIYILRWSLRVRIWECSLRKQTCSHCIPRMSGVTFTRSSQWGQLMKYSKSLTSVLSLWQALHVFDKHSMSLTSTVSIRQALYVLDKHCMSWTSTVSLTWLLRNHKCRPPDLLLTWMWCYFSPLGEVFRARLRQFPALVNCCTIDWFSEWPADALRSVALRFLMDIPELETTDQIMEGLVREYIHFSKNLENHYL